MNLFLYFLFLANLYSKDGNARNEAADACKRLASKISDHKALEEILKKCFAVFHGSEGKLSVVDHKISVLQVNFICVKENDSSQNNYCFLTGGWEFQLQ